MSKAKRFYIDHFWHYGPENDADYAISDELPWEEDTEAQRFVADHPDGAGVEQIGKIFGCTKQAVSQMEARALAKLREALGKKKYGGITVDDVLAYFQQLESKKVWSATSSTAGESDDTRPTDYAAQGFEEGPEPNHLELVEELPRRELPRWVSEPDFFLLSPQDPGDVDSQVDSDGSVLGNGPGPDTGLDLCGTDG